MTAGEKVTASTNREAPMLSQWPLYVGAALAPASKPQAKAVGEDIIWEDSGGQYPSAAKHVKWRSGENLALGSRASCAPHFPGLSA